MEADDTEQFLDAGGRYTQRLERLGYAYQTGRDKSFATSVRGIIGTPPTLQGFQDFSSAWDRSFAYHKRMLHDELYVVYAMRARF